MIDRFDKRRIWALVVRKVQEETRFDVLTLLQDKAYLDSLDNGIAIIGLKSSTWEEMLRRKGLVPVLQRVISELLKAEYHVRLVIGRPRIIEPKTKKFNVANLKAANQDEVELADLHIRYGDVMGIVDSHPLFLKASTPITAGGWGLFPQILTTICKEYGVMTVLECLRYVADQPHVTRPRAFFLKVLKSGQFGHRLAQGKAIIGPEMELIL